MAFSLPPSLHSALVTLADRLDGAGLDWVVSGSTARALRGFTVVPRDLDIEVAAGSVGAAAAAIGLVAAVDADPRATSTRAQGVWDGVPVDITGGLTLHGPGGTLHADYALLRRFAAPVTVGGRAIWAAPIEEQIARSMVAGTAERLDRIAAERPADVRVDDAYLSLRLAAASASR